MVNLTELSAKFTESVQDNIKLIESVHGNNFVLDCTKNGPKQIQIPVLLRKVKMETNKTEFYELCYDDPNKTYVQMPFSIWFIDTETLELNNNTYIMYIHATNNIGGDQMVELVLGIQRNLRVNKTVLHDSAYIPKNGINMNLSFLKLLQYRKTYYMRFGFKIELNSRTPWDFKFKNIKAFENMVNSIVDQIELITIDYIKEYYSRLNDILNTGAKPIIKYYNYYFVTPENYYLESDDNMANVIKNLKLEYEEVMLILNKATESKLKDLIVNSFNKNGRETEYVILNKYIMKGRMFEIIAGTDKLRNSHVKLFRLLNAIQYEAHYSYVFNEQLQTGGSETYKLLYLHKKKLYNNLKIKII